jgi:hypothetical protein
MAPEGSQVQGTCGFSSTVWRRWSSLSRSRASARTRSVVSTTMAMTPAGRPLSSGTGE